MEKKHSAGPMGTRTWDRSTWVKMARLRKQSGELSMIEGAALMAGAALLATLAYAGGRFILDRVHASQFKTEAQLVHTGIIDAAANSVDFGSATLATLAAGRAFDSMGTRVAADGSAVTGLFGGAVTVAAGKITSNNDALIMTYPVPAAVCALSAAAVANTYTQVKVNDTIISSPTLVYTDATATTACKSAGGIANMALYTSKS